MRRRAWYELQGARRAYEEAQDSPVAKGHGSQAVAFCQDIEATLKAAKDKYQLACDIARQSINDIL